MTSRSATRVSVASECGRRAILAAVRRLAILLAFGCGGTANEPRTPDDDLGVGQVYPPKPRRPGTINLNAVFEVLERDSDAIQACFDHDPATHPGLQYVVVKATFTVDPDGSASDVRAYAVNVKYAACIATRIKSLTFPTPTGGAASAYGEFFPFIPSGDTTAE